MTRSIIKAAAWALGPEAGEGAPQAVYSALCMACGAEAPASDDSPEPVEIWALKHTGLNPNHRHGDGEATYAGDHIDFRGGTFHGPVTGKQSGGQR